ncbi:hypothetical protein HMN09_00545700 [Mycena chlorophos]|uniref:Apple domain-containing protein n=1 Tax=Mycena chlorophos TaxID=658473 RepID=A0A8H6TAQ4_MYCCL|nr:hypothetical protein HMN09_00545700 [Mycena chlorophos]
MRLLFTLASIAIAISGASATFDPRTIDPNHNPTLALERRASIINAGDCYGAPIPPWEPHSQPGWYYGPCAYAPDGLLCLADSLVCLILDGILGLGFPFCPPYAPPNTPPGDTCGCSGSQGGGRSGGSSGGSQPQIPPPPAGYSYTFENLTCAAVGCPSYLTYGMVTNATGCAMMCDQTPKCIAANYYEDRNSSKPAGMLTCALFNQTRTQSDATNCGGQEQLLPKSNVTDQILYSYAIVKNSAKSG